MGVSGGCCCGSELLSTVHLIRKRDLDSALCLYILVSPFCYVMAQQKSPLEVDTVFLTFPATRNTSQVNYSFGMLVFSFVYL